MKLKKKREKTLQLNRETLRELYLREVRGGDHEKSVQSACDLDPAWPCDREIIF